MFCSDISALMLPKHNLCYVQWSCHTNCSKASPSARFVLGRMKAGSCKCSPFPPYVTSKLLLGADGAYQLDDLHFQSSLYNSSEVDGSASLAPQGPGALTQAATLCEPTNCKIARTRRQATTNKTKLHCLHCLKNCNCLSSINPPPGAQITASARQAPPALDNT